MARNIYCPDCDTRISKSAKSFGELYESISGTAKKDMKCDACDKNILVGDTCFASVLLPSVNHFNYQIQKPEVWASDFINTKQMKILETIKKKFTSRYEKFTSRYETSPAIRKEFSDILDWYRQGSGNLPLHKSEELVKMYCSEKDISFHGDLRKLNGANTRNASFELLLAVGAALLGIAIATSIFIYTIFIYT